MIELIPFSAPTYWLNYSVHNAVSAGAQLGDIERAIAPYLAHVAANRERFEHAKRVAPLRFDGTTTTLCPPDLAADMIAAVPIWCDGWIAEGERLAALADRFAADGHDLTAAGIYHRASVLISYAEWSMLRGPRKRETFDRGRELCMTAMRLGQARFEEVTIPYGEHTLEAMFWPAGDGPHPTAVCFNGLHSSMEWFWQIGLVDQLVRRGISVLVFDCPGSGSARFHQGLHMEPATERYATATVDYVVSRPDVDASRLASIGCSFGGYRTVRAAAHEPRFKMCLAWGALYEIAPPPAPVDGEPGGVGPAAMNGLDLDTIMWFMGADSIEELIERRDQFSLAGHLDGLRCPLVVFHGAADMQVPVEQARRVVAEAVNAASTELHVYTAGDGGEQHCHLDNPATALGHMTDRVAALLDT